MTVESALTFLLAIFIFGITPGPGVFAILGRALGEGAAACFFLALGMVVSDLVYLLLACLGLAALAEHWNAAFTVVRLTGAVYLVWLGVKMWRAPARNPSADPDRRDRSATSFLQGFLISVSNPKVILFYIAFLPTFMDLTALSRGDIALAVGLTLTGLMAALMTVAAGASSARRLIQSPRGQAALNRTAAVILLGAGLYLAVGN